jgi:lipopolysaccharide-induced tumor necrosis factor-alpha factor
MLKCVYRTFTKCARNHVHDPNAAITQAPHPYGQPQYAQSPPQYAQPPPGYTAQPPPGYMGGPPPGYGAQPGYAAPTVIVTGGSASAFGRESAQVVCTHCHQNVMTAVTSSPSATSWLCCVALCFVGAGPFALLPFCIDSCQDVVHSCPGCGYVMYRGSL